MAAKGGGKGETWIQEQGQQHKPKGLVAAFSEIQNYFMSERKGSPIQEEFFTFGGKIAFFEVGFKGGLLSALLSVLLTPFAIGVVEANLPIFGTIHPSGFDKFFAFAIALSFSTGYALLFAGLGKYYIGIITKSAIKNLLLGVFLAAAIKGILAFLAFHFIYFVMLEPQRLGKFLLQFSWLVKGGALPWVYQSLLEFRPVFLTSAYFVLITSALMILIPVAGIAIGKRKTEKAMAQEALYTGSGAQPVK